MLDPYILVSCYKDLFQAGHMHGRTCVKLHQREHRLVELDDFVRVDMYPLHYPRVHIELQPIVKHSFSILGQNTKGSPLAPLKMSQLLL